MSLYDVDTLAIDCIFSNLIHESCKRIYFVYVVHEDILIYKLVNDTKLSFPENA